MPDTFGGIQYPLTAPASPSEPVSDPGLQIIAEYLKACLNAYGAAPWAAVAPGQSVVSACFAHDPKEHVFNSKYLPALYLWRSRSARDELAADDYLIDKSQVSLLWFFQPAPQDRQRVRLPFFNAFEKTIRKVLKQGRDSNWVYPGDTDPTAASRGSLPLKLAGISHIRAGEFILDDVSIEVFEGDQLRAYDGIVGTLEIEEVEVRDPSVRTGGVTAASTSKLTADLDNSTNDLTQVSYQDPPEVP